MPWPRPSRRGPSPARDSMWCPATRFAHDHPLHREPRVVLTPHVAASTEAALIRAAERVADQVIAVLADRRPQNLVNAEVWDRRRRGEPVERSRRERVRHGNNGIAIDPDFCAGLFAQLLAFSCDEPGDTPPPMARVRSGPMP